MPTLQSLAEDLFCLVMRSASLDETFDQVLRTLKEPPSLVLGGGKAARAMADRVSSIYPNVRGAVAAPVEHADSNRPIRLLPAGHPLPTVESMAAMEDQERLAANHAGGSILFLLSGGASAMLGAPLPGLTLEELRAGYEQLLHAGLSVQQMNLVRRHLTRWGGGKLASKLRGDTLALVVSDVLDDDLRAIGSGPLVADESTFADALEILSSKSLAGTPIGRFCREGADGKHPETIRPGAAELTKVEHRIVLSNQTVIDRLRKAFPDVNVLPCETGPVETVAESWAARLRGRPGIYVAGGEPTVEIRGQGGRGGRNQHLVLETGLRAADAEDWLFLSIATDGIDGNSDNAGAWISKDIVMGNGPALKKGIESFNSADVAESLGIAFRSGPSGTNVADIQIGIVGVSSLN